MIAGVCHHLVSNSVVNLAAFSVKSSLSGGNTVHSAASRFSKNFCIGQFWSSGCTWYLQPRRGLRRPSRLVKVASKMGGAVDNTEDGPRKTPFLIGVAGGTASGKSTVCDRIMEAVIAKECTLEKQITSLSMDSFYRELNEEELQQAIQGSFNFDHPDAFDLELLLSCLGDIQQGRPTQIPVYDFKKNARVKGKFTTIHPSDVVLLEGILIFYNKEVRDMFDMKLFVDTDADTRLARRVLRDIEERGRELEHILHQYTTLVKPAFEEFCFPTKKFADVIIPRGADNSVAISLIVQHICDLQTKEIRRANIRHKGGLQAGPVRAAAAARRPHFMQPKGVSIGQRRNLHHRLSSSLSLPEINDSNEKVCMKSDFLALQTEKGPKAPPPPY